MATKTDEFTHGVAEFTDRITADPGAQWPVEPGRYRLVASLACPWAHRAIIVRRLLGLEDAISLAIVDPIQDERSWRFSLDPDWSPTTSIASRSTWARNGPRTTAPARRTSIRPRGATRSTT